MTEADRGHTWRSLALPSEHGGWSLTAEPALLGLIVAFSASGLALAIAAMVAFVVRTPLKVVMVDRWRRRWLPRSRQALRIVSVEIVLLALLAGVAALTSDHRWWIPLAIAAPLVAVELWYDMRSRSRRLIPEIAGTIGIGSVAAAIALAGGESTLIAIGLWCVVGARAVAAITAVRFQIMRARSHPHPRWHSDLGQLAALVAVVVGWALDAVPLAALVAVVVLCVFNVVNVTRPARPAVVIGVQQTVLGIIVVAVTATAVLTS